MGITFHCPNGHKLNVKAFLAGRKAVCPKCGQKVLVPVESEPGTASSKTSRASAAPEIPGTQMGVGTHTPETTSPAPVAVQPTAMQPTTGSIDAIAESPTAVWYVRPPSGGQFGPAAGDVMRSWLIEGRVTADSLVWRAGWPEWRSALSTFPQLAGASAPGNPAFGLGPVVSTSVNTVPVSVVPARVAPVMVAPAPLVSPVMPAGIPFGQMVGAPAYNELAGMEFQDAVTRTRRRRQKTSSATLIVSTILMVLVVVLFIVLGLVLLKQSQEEPAATPSPSRRAPATSDAERSPRADFSPTAESPTAGP